MPNRDSQTIDGIPATQGFDAANRPTTGGYAFDTDGRMTARPGTSGGSLEWDSLGRLIRVRLTPGGTVVAAYAYDALDRLRIVTRPGQTTLRFRYAGTTTAVAQVADDGTGTAIRNVATGPEGTVLEDWLTTSRRLYGTNGHHDTTWTADDTGAVTATARYDPWGNLLRSTGTLPDWRFQGSWADTSTGLAWSIARWYDPVLGSFISADTLLGEPANPPSRHLYAYGAGEPVGSWDPRGTIHMTLRPTHQFATEKQGDCYAGPAASPGWRVEGRSSVPGLGLTSSYCLIKASSGYSTALPASIRMWAVHLNAWLDEGANMDAGWLGSTQVHGKIRVLVYRRTLLGLTSKVIDWTPLYDFEACIVGGNYGGVCPGDYPNRSRPMQWHTSSSVSVTKGSRLKVQVILGVWTIARDGPWAEADAFLQLTKLGVDIDS